MAQAGVLNYYVVYNLFGGQQLEAGPYDMHEAILKRGEMSRVRDVMEAWVASENEPRPGLRAR